MASLRLEHIYKVYPNGVKAVNDFTMDIKDGEFIVFVGPSGCGKSTTLRMIAGLEEITAGELYIDDRIVNDVEPKDRDIAMVFQNYALYPHMTVYENMAFGLRLRHLPNDVIHDKVMWAADILGLKEYLDRKPKAMSGGQRQRVALGRAILRNPKVMLLDEPLSNLDAKLRTQMRSEISKLHVQLATTFIYVTHDQVEAMTLGDRVVVMSNGFVQQIDSPKNLYRYPVNRFVAGFIGTPQMNFFIGTLKRVGSKVEVAFKYSDAKISVPYEELIKVKAHYLDGKTEVYIGLRCEDIKLATDKGDANLIDVKVSHFEELGNEVLIYGDINMGGDGFEETNTRIILRARERGNLEAGDIVKCSLKMSMAHLFDLETEETIIPRIPSENIFEAKLSKGKLSLLGANINIDNLVRNDLSSDVSVILPTKAIKVVKKGTLTVKCRFIEEIGDTLLAHLVYKDRTFFAYVDSKDVLNKDVQLELDFTSIKIMNGEEVILEPLSMSDAVNARFINHLTLKRDVPNSPYIQKLDDDLLIAQNEIEIERAELLKRHQQEIEEAQKNAEALTSDQSNEETRAVLELEAKNALLIDEIKETRKVLIAKYKKEEKEARLAAKSENKRIFDERKATENREYQEFLSKPHDPDTIKARKEAHKTFNENFSTEKNGDLQNRLNGVESTYEGLYLEARLANNRKIKMLKGEIKEAKKRLQTLLNPVKSIKKRHQKELRSFEMQAKKHLKQASLLFYFNLYGHYEIVNQKLANKIIQGLGTSVFEKHYRIDIPHDAYTISEDEGISLLVEEVKYYEGIQYLHCLVTESNDEVRLLVKGKADVGQNIKVRLNLEKTVITESASGIRLY